jgi:NADPH-dependent 2,4-dienoyl-CoA reductase/sulfur reductase-like enzyme
VLVAGGGPAGLDAARLLAARGHCVTLCERADRLGGAGRAAAAFEPANGAAVDHLIAEVSRLPVELRLGCEVTAALVAALDPDVVVVAVGARAVRPAVPGADGERVFDLDTVRDHPERVLALRSTVAIVGGDLIGVEIAERLSELGCRVTVVEGGEKLGTNMAPPRRWRAVHLLRERGVRCLTGTRVAAIDRGALACVDGAGRETAVPAEAVIVTGVAPNLGLAEALRGSRARIEHIGDCGGQGLFEGAFLDAVRVGRAV